MTARLAATGLVAAALLLDALGVHGLAGLGVVAAVPTSGVAALQALDAAIARPGFSRVVHVGLAVLALALVLVAAVVRSPLGPEAPLSAPGITALVVGLLVFVLQGVVAGVSIALRRPRRRLGALASQPHLGPWARVRSKGSRQRERSTGVGILLGVL